MRKILSFLTAILFAGSMMATNYELVTSASQLQAGAKYVIGTASGKFIATTSNGNNRKITDGTITENVVEGTDDMMVFTLGGEADAWTFATDNYLGDAGYLNATSSTGSNYLKVVADLDDYAYFTIAIADGVTTVTCNGKASRNILYLNGTTCFACYNTQTQAQYIKPNLYKEVSDAPATDKTFYLALSADWAGWPAKYSMYYFKSENDANGFSAFMTAVPDTTNIYTGTIPDGYDKMIFVRHDGEASEPTWENKWSQTVNLDVPTNGDNLFTVVSGGTGSECNGTWSVYGEEPAPYVPTLENGFYLIGQNGWDVAALSADLLFAANQDTEGEYKLTTTLAEGQSIKVVKVENDAIVAWYPDGMGNEYTVDAAHAGENKDIYFQETYKEDWAAFGGHIWTGSNEPPVVEKYCEKPSGHLKDPNFGDPSGRILLTIAKGEGNNIVVKIKNNNEAGNPKTGLNYLWVNAEGATGGVVRYGDGTHAEADVEEVSVIVPFEEARESYNFLNIHWAYSGWEGEWAIDGLTVTAAELCEGAAPVEPTLANGFYLIGQNGWDVAALSADLLFAANPDTEGEYKLTTTLAEGQTIKVVKVENDAIVAWYPDGMGNEYTVDAAHAGENKDIYFQETYKEDWAAFGGYFWTGENGGTAISNTAADAEAVKVLNNGMLLIRKGNKTYNVMGQAVK